MNKFLIGRPRHTKRMRNLVGGPVKVVAQPDPPPPQADQRPDGKAAIRRRKQMERKNLPAEVQHAADSCDPSRADRQDLARQAYERALDISPELLEETVREVTAELHKSGMVIIDDAGVVPREVWAIDPAKQQPLPDREFWDGKTQNAVVDATLEEMARLSGIEGADRSDPLERLHRQSRAIVSGINAKLVERILEGQDVGRIRPADGVDGVDPTDRGAREPGRRVGGDVREHGRDDGGAAGGTPSGQD